jgi:ubiquinone/menaquinone biosynthesis C-methylase UbiE
VILDVGNGLGAQDCVIAETSRPRRLVAVNITEWQLMAGKDRLRQAGAVPVAGDAARLPIAGQTVDGIISVEAAFHFRSRKAFFAECYRVLRPGGVLSISDISAQRWRVTPAGQHAAARLLLWQVNLLWRRQIIDYLLLRAIRP